MAKDKAPVQFKNLTKPPKVERTIDPRSKADSPARQKAEKMSEFMEKSLKDCK